MARLDPAERFERVTEDLKDATSDMLGNSGVAFEDAREVLSLVLSSLTQVNRIREIVSPYYPPEPEE